MKYSEHKLSKSLAANTDSHSVTRQSVGSNSKTSNLTIVLWPYKNVCLRYFNDILVISTVVHYKVKGMLLI